MPNRPRFTSRTLSAQLLSLAIVYLLILQPVIFYPPTASAAGSGSGSVSLTTLGTAYTQDFNTLTNTPDAALTNVLPVGWRLDESGTAARNDGNYAVGTGGSNTGDTYAFGTPVGNSDRALGTLRSGTLIPIIGASFTNNTGSTVTSLDVSYTGEQWRLGTSNRTTPPTIEKLDFQISTDATSLTTGTYTDVNSLDFQSPIAVGTVGALNGNNAPNRTALSFSITGLSIANGSTFFIRWTDFDVSGADDGLGVDDFSITPQGVGPTNPTGVGAANPSSVAPGGNTLLTVAVTPGTNPASVTHTVTADLTAIGGAANQSFYDDGLTGGDATAGDNIFSYSATVANGTSGGGKNLPATITETSPLSRTGSANISLTVLTPTNPSGVGSANPNNVEAGGTTLLTVAVTPGSNPTSTD